MLCVNDEILIVYPDSIMPVNAFLNDKFLKDLSRDHVQFEQYIIDMSDGDQRMYALGSSL